MSHSDSIKALPTNGLKLASTHDVNLQLIKSKERHSMLFITIQVFHSTDGSHVRNFLVRLLRFRKLSLLRLLSKKW
jgi:GMP synthase (glutamine-hydrolysing)